ncbi:MAG: RibD family protein [Candidatus Macondimonas sp.]
MYLPASGLPAVWDVDRAWAAIRAVDADVRAHPSAACVFDLAPDGLRRVLPGAPLRPDQVRILPDGRWRSTTPLSEPVAQMFDLYLPLACCLPGRRLVIAHLGQSLDGRIAPAEGCSAGLTGPENYDHMHRLRALVDAVVVGAATVRADDPQLTVRRVPGRHPARVVIDTDARLDGRFRMLADGAAPVVYCRADDTAPNPHLPGHVVQITVRRGTGGLDLANLLDVLAARGWSRVLVEGGGVTVSRFLDQGCLDRLQITVAPVLLGAGHLGIDLPEGLSQTCRRPAGKRYLQGCDVLFDLDVSGQRA